MTSTEQLAAGALLRRWRRQRRLSQMALSLEADVPQRHLSCIEAGRAMPSRAMVLHLTEHLPVPVQARGLNLVLPECTGIAVPLRLAGLEGPLSSPSTTTVFGTAVDVTLAEVTVEAFFPADQATAMAMRTQAGSA